MSRASSSEQPAISLDQINGNHNTHGTNKRYTSGGVFETDPKGVDHASPSANGQSQYRTFGFAICDPGYQDGEIPSRDSHNRTDVDIIGVAAVGADPVITWRAEKKHTRGTEIANVDRLNTPMWIISDIRQKTTLARVLLYDGHSEPSEGQKLLDLARKLLMSLHKLRDHEKKKRPYFLICHSTGGLVAKLALIEASRGNPKDKSLLADCYGITFLATPHQGSSYLSLPEFSQSIVNAMRLKRPLPMSLQVQLQVNHELLRSMASRFKLLAADLVVFTFYETEDTDLTIPETASSEKIPLSAPITSIRSAMLDLYHEIDYPMMANHIGCASFSGENTQTKNDYLEQLKAAIERAKTLSDIPHFELNLQQKVKVEINGFYQGIPHTEGADPPIRLWSSRKSLKDFLELGPLKCLEDRLKEDAPPAPSQFLSSDKQISASINNRLDKPSESGLPLKKEGESSRKPFASGLQPAGKREFSPPPEASKGQKRRLGLQKATAEAQQQPVAPFSARSSNSRRSSLTNTIKNQIGGGRKGSIPNLVFSNVDETPNRPHAADYFPESTHDHEATTARSTSVLTGTAGQRGVTGRVDFAISDEHNRRSSVPIPESSEEASTELDLAYPSNSASYNPLPKHDEDQGDHRNVKRDSSRLPPPLPPPRFIKPNVQDRMLTWVHVPFNNPLWVAKVLSIATSEQGRDAHERILDHKHWESRHVRGRHSEHNGCFVKHGCQLIPPETGATTQPTSPLSPSMTSPDDFQISLYLPYLHWDTYKMLIKRRLLVKSRILHGRSRPVPKDVSEMELEHKVTWAFSGYDPPFNGRRTLDQFGYPNLHDTRARDDDQVLYKMTKERRKVISKPSRIRGSIDQPGAEDSGHEDSVTEDSDDDQQISQGPTHIDTAIKKKTEETVLDGAVLMVDQLWLWALESKSANTTVTFFPRRESKPSDGRLHQQADLRDSIYNEVNADLARPCKNSLDLAALVALHAVTILIEGSSYTHLEVFRIFEESISILIEKLTNSFKDFRSQGFKDKSTEYENNIINIKENHRREGKISEKQNRDDTSAMLELRDINDELQTLHKLFEQQKETIEQMYKLYEGSNCASKSENGRSILQEALDKLGEYSHQIDIMIKNTERTREDFDKLLNLKQRQANVDEARLARYQADLASAQSRAVLVFTVFTVIFLPLTFFTGLFGMNISEWSGTTTNVSWQTVVSWSLPLSFMITLSALVLALSLRVRKSAKGLSDAITSIGRRLALICIWFLNLLHISHVWVRVVNSISILVYGDIASDDTHIKRRKTISRRDTNVYYEDDDFWDQHRSRRQHEYNIPWHNQKAKVYAGGRRRLSHRVTTSLRKAVTLKDTKKDMVPNRKEPSAFV